jgi:hypothetical protein
MNKMKFVLALTFLTSFVVSAETYTGDISQINADSSLNIVKTKKYAVVITSISKNSENNNNLKYLINYPTLNCKGKLYLYKKVGLVESYVEEITTGHCTKKTMIEIQRFESGGLFYEVNYSSGNSQTMILGSLELMD